MGGLAVGIQRRSSDDCRRTTESRTTVPIVLSSIENRESLASVMTTPIPTATAAICSSVSHEGTGEWSQVSNVSISGANEATSTSVITTNWKLRRAIKKQFYTRCARGSRRERSGNELTFSCSSDPIAKNKRIAGEISFSPAIRVDLFDPRGNELTSWDDICESRLRGTTPPFPSPFPKESDADECSTPRPRPPLTSRPRERLPRSSLRH